jgi:hypothetical protein
MLHSLKHFVVLGQNNQLDHFQEKYQILRLRIMQVYQTLNPHANCTRQILVRKGYSEAQFEANACWRSIPKTPTVT